MIRTLLVVASLATISPAIAQTAPARQCQYSAEELSSAFGQAFRPGVPENGLLGQGCRYDSTEVKVWVDAGPMPTPTAAQWRKMSSPAGISWQPVAGDADNAVFEVAKPDAYPYPKLSYERKGWLVEIRVVGDIEKGYANRKAAVDAWQARLVKLRRFP